MYEAHVQIAQAARDDAVIAGIAGAAGFERIRGDIERALAGDAFAQTPLRDDAIFRQERRLGGFQFELAAHPQGSGF